LANEAHAERWTRHLVAAEPPGTSPMAVTMPHLSSRARPDGAGAQIVEVVVADGYHPSAIEARAGVPLRVVFRRRDDDPCSERVIFSDPRLERRLPPDGVTEILLAAHGPGRIRFTCGMGRYRGVITLRPEPRRRPLELSQAFTGRLDTLGLAAAVWLCSLPVVALLAIVLFDPRAIIPAALLALAACVAGCYWAARRSHHAV
jgi:hypothetical protein